jgi:gluconate 5-dehydrogenase
MSTPEQLFDLEGKVALVTGGSRGLGLEIAQSLGEAHARVIITARRTSWLDEAEADLRRRGIECRAMVCDVTKPDAVNSTIAAAIGQFGRLDILVNNAGSAWGAPAETMPLEKWQEVLTTNATGCFLMSQAAGREMIRAGAGNIINMASVVGLIGTEPELLDAVAYSASKGAIMALTRDLAVKWAPHGIRVNAIAPGFFQTRMTAGVIERAGEAISRRTPLGRIGRPGEIGGVVIFLASAAAKYLTGQTLVVDGGLTVL